MESDGNVALEARGIVKRYGDLVAVDGLDVRVARGTCLGLLGPNGAGKSTTINILVGLLAPDEGEVRVLGRPWRGNQQSIREQIGVQLQETMFNDKLQVGETLQLFRSFYREGRDVDEVIELVGLKEKRRTRYVHLSGGQKQRLALGCALVGKPLLLFLDEPTTGLDPQARRRVWEIVEEIKKDGGTVLLTTPYMDEAELLSDHVVIVDHGRSIEEGTPRQVVDRLGAGSVVEFTLVSLNGELDLAPVVSRLESLEGVHRARADALLVTLHVEETQLTLPAIIESLGVMGVGLSDLHTHRPTLEDVFVERTGRHLRDA